MAVDEATANMIAMMAQAGRKPIFESTPEEARAFGPQMIALFGPGPEVARTEDTVLEAADGGKFEVRAHVPAGDVRGVLVYYHGGGWVVGSIDQSDHLGRKLANRTHCAVVLVNYRKAPEHPYPAPVEDAWTALQWAAEHVEELAGKPVPLIVAGDSAGGNLAAVVAQRARDRQGPKVALQVLIYPVTDADLDNGSYRDPENQLLLTRESMIWFWNHYVPDEDDRKEPDASPARAADLSNLPPAVVLTAEHDVLREEGEAYAEALKAAGVPVKMKRFPGQTHGFFSMIGILPGHDAGVDYVVAALEEELSG